MPGLPARKPVSVIHTRVKVCCIANVAEAEMAIAAGAWALGLVAEMPSGPGPIPDDAIAEIARAVPPGVETFLLTSRVEADGIIEHHRHCGTTALQLVDRVPFDDLKRLRRALPGVRLVQVVHVTGPDSVSEAQDVAGLVDMVLLDSGQPQAELRTLGGTGNTHDWDISRIIRERLDLPVWLAGGLNEANVSQAIRHVGPFGVDLCSSLRPDGRLHAQRLDAFFKAVRSA